MSDDDDDDDDDYYDDDDDDDDDVVLNVFKLHVSEYITYMLTSTQAPAALGAGVGTADTLDNLGHRKSPPWNPG